MRNFRNFGLGVLCQLLAATAYAADFDVLPDIPEAFSMAVPQANASTVSGVVEGTTAVGHEPSIVSVAFSLLIVIVLIYITGIIYAKLNKTGFKVLNKSHSSFEKSQIAVLSTTQLGNNKTLHVVELDGKRMLIGAATGAIQLIKDLGTPVSDEEMEDIEHDFSHIEIPNIKIPKIEIPKIEIPSIGFSKIITKAHKGLSEAEDSKPAAASPAEEPKPETITKNRNKVQSEDVQDTLDIFYSEGLRTPDEKVDASDNLNAADSVEEPVKSEHIVDPDEYSLYKKYLG